jgi:hypothetical protein
MTAYLRGREDEGIVADGVYLQDYNMPLSTHGRRTEGKLLGVLAVGHQVEEGWHSIKPRLASRCSILELLASHAGKLRLGVSPHVLLR